MTLRTFRPASRLRTITRPPRTEIAQAIFLAINVTALVVYVCVAAFAAAMIW